MLDSTLYSLLIFLSLFLSDYLLLHFSLSLPLSATRLLFFSLPCVFSNTSYFGSDGCKHGGPGAARPTDLGHPPLDPHRDAAALGPVRLLACPGCPGSHRRDCPLADAPIFAPIRKSLPKGEVVSAERQDSRRRLGPGRPQAAVHRASGVGVPARRLRAVGRGAGQRVSFHVDSFPFTPLSSPGFCLC